MSIMTPLAVRLAGPLGDEVVGSWGGEGGGDGLPQGAGVVSVGENVSVGVVELQAADSASPGLYSQTTVPEPFVPADRHRPRPGLACGDARRRPDGISRSTAVPSRLPTSPSSPSPVGWRFWAWPLPASRRASAATAAIDPAHRTGLRTARFLQSGHALVMLASASAGLVPSRARWVVCARRRGIDRA
jgi:hypothetical protein